MDKLSSVLNAFSLNADVFYSGNLCGTQIFHAEDHAYGHLHLLRSGRLEVKGNDGFEKILETPSVLFFPNSFRHQLFADEHQGVDLVCAKIQYQETHVNPLIKALPVFLYYEMEHCGLLGETAIWIFKEAFEEKNGKQFIVNRLCDVFLINILRQVLEEGLIKEGMMAGLAHPQMTKVLVKIHQHPEINWTLSSMADVCAMSRSKFAEVFKMVIGNTPLDYLTDWRISVAQKWILKGQGMDWVANQVGYENGSALARVFRKKMGLSPKEWLAEYQTMTNFEK
ncbi:MAG: AraC family transcriptional regulator [Pseudomonadota bacterium]